VTIGVFGGPRNGKEREEPRAEDAKDATGRRDTRGALPRLRGRPVGDLGGAVLPNGLGRYQGSRCFAAHADASHLIVPSRWSVMCDRVYLVGTPAVTARRAFRSNLALRRRITFAPGTPFGSFGSLAPPGPRPVGLASETALHRTNAIVLPVLVRVSVRSAPRPNPPVYAPSAVVVRRE
jgi:hypothetical protein